MTKLKKIDYKVVYNSYNSFSTTSSALSGDQELTEDMQASIQISTGDYFQYKVFPIDDSTEDVRTLDLVEGDADYHIEIVLTLNDEYIGGFNGDVRLSGVDVANADKITFHAIKYVPTPFTKEEKLDMMEYILDGDYRQELRPELR